jgi:hypothetical protein
MHSLVLPGKPGARLSGIRRRLARRADAPESAWQARHRRPDPWAEREANRLNPARAPEESYRDYMFRSHASGR